MEHPNPFRERRVGDTSAKNFGNQSYDLPKIRASFGFTPNTSTQLRLAKNSPASCAFSRLLHQRSTSSLLIRPAAAEFLTAAVQSTQAVKNTVNIAKHSVLPANASKLE
jgi:hypothetical protein